jgi:tRNA-Thr(GGU) m(6)t(6)A37 methyltransferase TsaA
MYIKPIGTIHNSFKTKFGIPRQSCICDIESKIVFEKEFNVVEAFRCIEQFSHLWLIWGFTEFEQTNWKPTVRPPRLGGNKRVGVFSTRSPHRPNSLGLSSVKLIKVETDSKSGVVLTISGADIMDGTPIYDIKPYISFTDSHPDAVCGFADEFVNFSVPVHFSDEIINVPESVLSQIHSVLSNDPKPSYQKDEDRIYGMRFDNYEVKFKYVNEAIIVVSIENENV